MISRTRKLAFVLVPTLAAAIGTSTLVRTSPPQAALAPGGQTQISSLPYTISISGSYYVSQELVQTTLGGLGISITASDVTLDLNGFRVRNVGASTGTSAIALAASAHRVTVRNGIIGPWYGAGVSGSSSDYCQVIGVTLDSNATGMGSGGGISLRDRAVVRDCIAYSNENGITIGADGLLSGCVVSSSGEHGIRTGDRCRVLACASSDNGSPNSVQLSVGNGSTVRDCTVTIGFGGIHSLVAGDGCVITGCTIRLKTNDFGLQAGNGCAISGCSVTSTTAGDPVTFISTGNNCSVLDCTTSAFSSSSGTGTGIQVGRGCRVSRCSTSGGYFGIATAASGSRIEDNRTGGALTGISVTAGGNIVLRNSVTGGSGYAIVAGNSYGPIVNVAGAGDISAVANADHPWANFRH